MKILYDHQAFDLQTHGGVTRCFYELYSHLPINVSAEISVRESNNVYIQKNGIYPLGHKYEYFIKQGNWPLKGKVFSLYNKICGIDYWGGNKALSIKKIKNGNFDIFHPTYFDNYFLDHLDGKPFVLTIHDMIPELYPQYFSANDFQIIRKRELAPLATAIIAVSENTKKDIINILNVPEEKIHVIYHGANIINSHNDKKTIEFQYILYVGSRFGYKNFKNFVQFIKPFLDKNKSIKVICTGTVFNKIEKELLSNLKLEEFFIHFFPRTDQDLYSLYKNAICFIYPSEYEGFGIPILEAYSADCLVLLNKASCFPEIAGDAAIYFTMNKDSSNLCEQLDSIIHLSHEERNILLQKQRERLQLYSWDKAANQLAQLYSSII